MGGPLSQMSEAVNKIDNGSNQSSTINGIGNSASGLSNSNEMFTNNKVHNRRLGNRFRLIICNI